jgi:methionyl-tRNA formyltransferase
MRIIFMGTPKFAAVSLQRLLQASLDIVTVVTAPDKPAGRGLHLHVSAVKELAQQHNLPVLQPEKLHDPDFISAVQACAPDLIVVVAFRILPEEVIKIPLKGTVNLHASLLPKYRGAAPIYWAIINGEAETGLTTFYIRKTVDTGNIIDTVRVEISPEMTTGELHDILADRGAELLVKTIRLIGQGRAKAYVQNEALASKAPKITHQDCQINFNKPVQSVHNLIRGLSPFPAAFTYWQEKLIRLYTTRVVDLQKKDQPPGTIVDIVNKDKLIIQCAPGWLEVREVQLESKKRMSVQEFLLGHSLAAGERLINVNRRDIINQIT